MTRALTGSREDRESQKREKRQRLIEKEDIIAVVKYPAGRRLLMRILDELQPRRRKMTTQAVELYNFGMMLRDWLDDAMPLVYVRMIEEQIEYRQMEKSHEESREEKEGDEEETE